MSGENAKIYLSGYLHSTLCHLSKSNIVRVVRNFLSRLRTDLFEWIRKKDCRGDGLHPASRVFVQCTLPVPNQLAVRLTCTNVEYLRRQK